MKRLKAAREKAAQPRSEERGWEKGCRPRNIPPGKPVLGRMLPTIDLEEPKKIGKELLISSSKGEIQSFAVTAQGHRDL